MPYKMETLQAQISENVTIKQLIAGILGDEAKVINTSLVVSLPGTQEQAWHCDGPHVSLTEHLPCHCLNVFIPLIDITMDCGPTAFRPESHMMTRDLTKMFFQSVIKKTLRPIVSPELSQGSILLVMILTLI